MLRLATPPRDLDPLVYSKEMQDKDLLSIAQLLDCCSLYYVYRDRTVAQLVQKAMENRPELLKSELPKTLNSVSDVVTELSTRLRHGSEEDSGWKDAMAYLSDIVCTIALFFRAAPRHVCRVCYCCRSMTTLYKSGSLLCYSLNFLLCVDRNNSRCLERRCC